MRTCDTSGHPEDGVELGRELVLAQEKPNLAVLLGKEPFRQSGVVVDLIDGAYMVTGKSRPRPGGNLYKILVDLDVSRNGLPSLRSVAKSPFPVSKGTLSIMWIWLLSSSKPLRSHMIRSEARYWIVQPQLSILSR